MAQSTCYLKITVIMTWYEHNFGSCSSWLKQHCSSPVLKQTRSWAAYSDRKPMMIMHQRGCLRRTVGDRILSLEAPHVTQTFLFSSRSACELDIMITVKAEAMTLFMKRCLIPYFPQTSLSDEWHAITGQPNHHITWSQRNDSITLQMSLNISSETAQETSSAGKACPSSVCHKCRSVI